MVRGHVYVCVHDGTRARLTRNPTFSSQAFINTAKLIYEKIQQGTFDIKNEVCPRLWVGGCVRPHSPVCRLWVWVDGWVDLLHALFRRRLRCWLMQSSRVHGVQANGIKVGPQQPTPGVPGGASGSGGGGQAQAAGGCC